MITERDDKCPCILFMLFLLRKQIRDPNDSGHINSLTNWNFNLTQLKKTGNSNNMEMILNLQYFSFEDAEMSCSSAHE